MQQTTTQQTQDISQRFLLSAVANIIKLVMMPIYYAIRSDMGVQFTGFQPIAASLGFYIAVTRLYWAGGDIDGKVVGLFTVIVALGYIRNVLQARQRRQKRDWSVHSWSTGVTLLHPISVFICREMHRRWGANSIFVQRLVRKLSSMDFLRYVAEPGMLLSVAAALWSIGSHLYLYSAILGVGLTCISYDADLRIYLQAHEIADGKMLEREIMQEFNGPATTGGASIALAQIPAAPSIRKTSDDQIVFERLSPELQMLLLRDRAARP